MEVFFLVVGCACTTVHNLWRRRGGRRAQGIAFGYYEIVLCLGGVNILHWSENFMTKAVLGIRVGRSAKGRKYVCT